jgi:hypothetical protein
MVLILDGEELVGAKQNRVVNTTLLIAAAAVAVIPVSCVEQGRWSYDSPKFSSKQRLMASTMRASKSVQIRHSLKRSGTFVSDQGAIWADIAQKADRMDAESPSMAMAAIYERQASNLKDYLAGFRCVERQVGAVFAVNGKVVGVECFGKSETFAKHFKKIVESYALDAVDGQRASSKRSDIRRKAQEVIGQVRASRFESFQSVGLGDDIRVDSENVCGFALAYGGKVLHLSVFARNSAGEEKPFEGSRLARFSRRRRFQLE